MAHTCFVCGTEIEAWKSICPTCFEKRYGKKSDTCTICGRTMSKTEIEDAEYDHHAGICVTCDIERKNKFAAEAPARNRRTQREVQEDEWQAQER